MVSQQMNLIGRNSFLPDEPLGCEEQYEIVNTLLSSRLRCEEGYLYVKRNI